MHYNCVVEERIHGVELWLKKFLLGGAGLLSIFTSFRPLPMLYGISQDTEPPLKMFNWRRRRRRWKLENQTSPHIQTDIQAMNGRFRGRAFPFPMYYYCSRCSCCCCCCCLYRMQREEYNKLRAKERFLGVGYSINNCCSVVTATTAAAKTPSGVPAAASSSRFLLLLLGLIIQVLKPWNLRKKRQSEPF